MAFGWYNAAWTKVKKATIPAAKVGGSGTIEDVRILVSVTDVDVLASAQADGDDILFCDADGATKLAHDLISYNGGTGAILAWVLVPTLDGSVNNTIWMYYGNAGAAAQENKAGTWKDATVLPATAVFHFENDVVDSSGNVNDGTNDGTIDVAGKIGRARTFDGANDAISAVGAGFVAAEQLTSNAIGVYLKAGASGDRQQIFYKGNTGKETLDLFLDEDGKLTFMVYLAGMYEYYAVGTTNLKDSAWHRCWGIRDGSTFRVVVDGVDDTDTVVGGALSTSTTEGVLMGKRLNEDYFLNADVDEIFVLEGAPSVNWCLTEFNSLDDPATFVTFGAEATYVESTGQEMNFFPTEDIQVDIVMPWWHDPLHADRAMVFTQLEQIDADLEMPVSIGEHPDIVVDKVMVFYPLEELAPDREMPTTILEELVADIEMPTDPLQGIVADRSMVMGQSQDRADDREMPVTILEELVFEEEMPVPIMENIVTDIEIPVPIVQSIFADSEMPMFSRASLVSDQEMPETISEEIIADRAMVVRNDQGVLNDLILPATVLEEIIADREMVLSADEMTVAADREMVASLAEIIRATEELPASWVEPVTADEEMSTTVLEEIEANAVMGISLSESLEADREMVVRNDQGVLNDLILPATMRQAIESDIEMPGTISEQILKDLKPVVFLYEDLAPTPVSADRTMPMFMREGINENVEMPAMISQLIEAMREMPMEWWDEVKERIPDGKYRLLVQTYQYQLEAMVEDTVQERGATHLVGER